MLLAPNQETLAIVCGADVTDRTWSVSAVICRVPPGGYRLPMLLSGFSHYSFIHLAVNMFVLHSFSTSE